MNQYIRISRTAARRNYYQGKTIVLVPDFIESEAMWKPSWFVDMHLSATDFEDKVADFQFTNCNKRCGYRVKYYIRKEDIA